MTPCLSKPIGKNKYYIKAPSGYNPCILGNNSKGQRDKYLDVLPNCVSWAVGRFNEIVGKKNCDLLYIVGKNNNAKNLIAHAKAQGLEVTKEPTLGGCMVWTHKAKAGHVAIVERIIDAKTVVTSESEWNGKVFSTYTRVRGNGNWRTGCYWMTAEYGYLGCIKNPAVEEDIDVTEKELRQIVREEIAAADAERKNLPADAYAVDALKWAKETGIMAGGASGNQMPQALIKREDVAVMLLRLYNLIASR